jgi:hypothetical protein
MREDLGIARAGLISTPIIIGSGDANAPDVKFNVPGKNDLIYLGGGVAKILEEVGTKELTMSKGIILWVAQPIHGAPLPVIFALGNTAPLLTFVKPSCYFMNMRMRCFPGACGCF